MSVERTNIPIRPVTPCTVRGDSADPLRVAPVAGSQRGGSAPVHRDPLSR